jgi:hypothetical protein
MSLYRRKPISEPKGRFMTLLAGLGTVLAVFLRKLRFSVKIKLSYH